MPAVLFEMGACAATGNFVARQIRRVDRAFLDVTELGLCHVFVAWFYFQRHSRARKRNFPRRFGIPSARREHPGIQFWQFEMPRFRQGHLIRYFLVLERLGNSELGIFAKSEVEPRDIEPGEIHAIVDTVIIGIVLEKCIVPRLKSVA